DRTPPATRRVIPATPAASRATPPTRPGRPAAPTRRTPRPPTRPASDHDAAATRRPRRVPGSRPSPARRPDRPTTRTAIHAAPAQRRAAGRGMPPRQGVTVYREGGCGRRRDLREFPGVRAWSGSGTMDVTGGRTLATIAAARPRGDETMNE